MRRAIDEWFADSFMRRYPTRTTSDLFKNIYVITIGECHQKNLLTAPSSPVGAAGGVVCHRTA